MACRTHWRLQDKPSGYALARVDDYSHAPGKGDGRSLPAPEVRLDGSGWTQIRHSTHPETGDLSARRLGTTGRRFSPHYEGGCYNLRAHLYN